MTNTVIGFLFLLGAALVITLYSCNRNNSKTETESATLEKEDSIIVSQKTDSIELEVDSLVIEKMDSATKETRGGERIITDDEPEQILDKENATTQPGITEETEQKSAKTEIESEGEIAQLSLKDNVDKPATGKGSGIKATGAIKSREIDKSKRVLIVGSGGGVTGEVHEYRIEADGSVYEKRSLGVSANSKKSLKVDQFQKINQLFDDLNIDTIKYNNPGNLYYFVGYELAGKTYKVTWGGADDSLPKAVKEYYDFAINHLSQ